MMKKNKKLTTDEAVAIANRLIVTITELIEQLSKLTIAYDKLFKVKKRK